MSRRFRLRRRACPARAARAFLAILLGALATKPVVSAQTSAVDLKSVPFDLTPPPVTEAAPAPGRRVLQALPGYEHTAVRHTIFLPADWTPGRKFPVIVEYAGNGRTVAAGQACLGYGLSGGRGFIWLSLPFVGEDRRHDTATWWCDLAASVGLGLGGEEPAENAQISSVPNALILFNPVLDTTEQGYGAKNFKPDQQTALSPSHHVRKGLPPTIIFHGTADTTVPFENAERFTRLMTAAGNPCTLVPLLITD